MKSKILLGCVFIFSAILLSACSSTSSDFPTGILDHNVQEYHDRPTIVDPASEEHFDPTLPEKNGPPWWNVL